MSARPTIDSLRFARAGESLQETLPVGVFLRLFDLLASDAGTVTYRLCGGVHEGRPVLDLEVDATLEMQCQRCLEPSPQSVHASSRMPLARDEAEMARWEHDDPLLDVLIADSRLDVLGLVEDEVLLSLPLAPRHAVCGLVHVEN